jgi:hypothetical protein
MCSARWDEAGVHIGGVLTEQLDAVMYCQVSSTIGECVRLRADPCQVCYHAGPFQPVQMSCEWPGA